MNLSPFKRDIDELIDEFVKGNLTTFADMKRVWLSRKFTYIYEARPNTNLGFFIQSLYAFAIGHMVSTDSLSRRLGGLYCLYCLHETQPFKPKFRIYISLQELGKVRDLIVQAKENGVEEAAAVAKQMLGKYMLIFGFVDLKEASAAEKIHEAKELQNRFLRVAHDKIFANSPIEKFLHLDMGKEVGLAALDKISKEYAMAKKHAVEAASKVGNVQDIKHISEEKELMGERVNKLVKEWNEQRQSFHQQTDTNRLSLTQTQKQPSEQEGVGEDKHVEQQDDEDEGFDEVERLLLQI